MRIGPESAAPCDVMIERVQDVHSVAELKISGRVAKMPSDVDAEVRSSVSTDLTFEEIRRVVQVDHFSLDVPEGYQRSLDLRQVQKLVREMRAGTFTPAPITLSVRRSHIEKMTCDGSSVTITASPEDALSVVDGQHRIAALEQLCVEDFQKWGAATLHVVVLLEPDRRAEAFIALQKGKSVSKSHEKIVSLKTGLLAEDKTNELEFATEVLKRQSESNQSFMGNCVSWDGADSGVLQYASLVSDNASSIATTVLGGVRIARDHGMSAEWLAGLYIDVYQGLLKYCEPTNPTLGETSVRKVFSSGMLLQPVISRGKRGGSHLLVGVCNMFAWRLLSQGKQGPEEEDLKQLAKVVDSVFMKKSDRGDVESKRVYMTSFARAYSKDLRIAKFEGVPNSLIDVLSLSTFKLDEGKAKEYRKEQVAERRAEKTKAKAKPQTPRTGKTVKYKLAALPPYRPFNYTEHDIASSTPPNYATAGAVQ